jgi:hypothetical protein
MNSERKIPVILGGILFSISALLVARFPPNVLAWGEPLGTSPLLDDLVMLAFPIIGIWSGIEFLRKASWGWAGLLFHLVIWYTAIGYTILGIVDAVAIFQQGAPVVNAILDGILAAAGWLGMGFYYD